MTTYKNLFESKTTVAVSPLSVTQVHLPVVSDAGTKKLTEAKTVHSEMEVSEFGTQAGKEIAALADTVLQKTTTGKMGEFGDGITKILKLTSSVSVDDLNLDKNKGFLGKIVGAFKDKKVEVLASFQSTSASIQKVADELATRQVTMRTDNDFLDKLYDKNMEEYHDLGASIEAVGVLMVGLNSEYEAMKVAAQNSTDQFEIQNVNEKEQLIKRWEKQVDRLKRMQQIALLTAPEIRLIQTGNVTMVEKFNDLLNTTLPAWKKQLSMTILAMRQKENAALGNEIDNKTNQFFKKAAELNNMNAIATAKSGERSVVDIETLEFMQNQLIDSVKQVKAIQEQGRQDRKDASVRIDTLRDQMKAEMLTWSK